MTTTGDCWVTGDTGCGSAGGEVPLVSFQWASATDPLDEHTLAAVAAGASTRRYASTLDRCRRR